MQTTKDTDDRKLEELVLYISNQCSDHKLFGAIKLNKILFYSDFLYYQTSGKSITGAEYQKLERGPAPRRMLPVLAKLQGDGSVIVKERSMLVCGARRTQKRPVAQREPDLSIFTGGEIAFVDSIIQQLKDETACSVSDMSHDHLGWRLARMNETIPYEAAFLATGSDPLSQADTAAGEKLRLSLQ